MLLVWLSSVVGSTRGVSTTDTKKAKGGQAREWDKRSLSYGLWSEPKNNPPPPGPVLFLALVRAPLRPTDLVSEFVFTKEMTLVLDMLSHI